MVGRAPGCAAIYVNSACSGAILNTEQQTHHALLTPWAHALLPRFLQGRKAKFVPGWDCHGLPIELKVGERGGRCTTVVNCNARPARWRCQLINSAARPSFPLVLVCRCCSR